MGTGISGVMDQIPDDFRLQLTPDTVFKTSST